MRGYLRAKAGVHFERLYQTRTGDILGLVYAVLCSDLNARKYMLKNVSASVAATGSGLLVMASGPQAVLPQYDGRNCCNSSALLDSRLKQPHQELTTRMAAPVGRRQSAPAQ
jgi:hypothetical protein